VLPSFWIALYFLYLLRVRNKNTLWGWVVSSHARDWFPIRICYASNLVFKKNNTKLTGNGNSYNASPRYVWIFIHCLCRWCPKQAFVILGLSWVSLWLTMNANISEKDSLHLQPWRWTQYFSPKLWHLLTSLHGAKTQNNNIINFRKIITYHVYRFSKKK
jgi:hypothetical protein